MLARRSAKMGEAKRQRDGKEKDGKRTRLDQGNQGDDKEKGVIGDG
jgi:hypothetical protein